VEFGLFVKKAKLQENVPALLYNKGMQPTRGTTVSSEFQALTGPYQRELLVHCYRMLGSLDDAEDALQECLLRAWRRLETLDSPGTLRAWLYCPALWGGS